MLWLAGCLLVAAEPTWLLVPPVDASLVPALGLTARQRGARLVPIDELPVDPLPGQVPILLSGQAQLDGPAAPGLAARLAVWLAAGGDVVVIFSDPLDTRTEPAAARLGLARAGLPSGLNEARLNGPDGATARVGGEPLVVHAPGEGWLFEAVLSVGVGEPVLAVLRRAGGGRLVVLWAGVLRSALGRERLAGVLGEPVARRVAPAAVRPESAVPAAPARTAAARAELPVAATQPRPAAAATLLRPRLCEALALLSSRYDLAGREVRSALYACLIELEVIEESARRTGREAPAERLANLSRAAQQALNAVSALPPEAE